MAKVTLSKTEKKKQNIAIAVLVLLCAPILYLYISFFSLAFFNSDGAFTLSNFDFLYKPMKLKQTTIQPIGKSFVNTVYFTIIVTLSEVVISCLAGYALSRLQFRGRKTIQYSLLILRMFPNLLLLIAVLYVLIALHIVNTMVGVILVAIAFRIPGSTFIIKNFFDGIPRDIENSTLVDGCSRLSGFFQVIIYLVKPGIASISIFSFLSAWSNYILFNTLIFNSKTPVIATYLHSLSRSEQMIADYGVFAAMAIVYMLPVFVFFVISQKQLMEGNIGGGKGV
ncbi:carbohydrate ABC transporter permease [Hungatella hathewayi]|uniref:carbohydrate ABC transporter permease n=1 Tax=Hungatella hathewayi TaxID=154046 RepID=UPI003563D79C